MFKNGLNVRASSALSGSKVKQLQARLAASFPSVSRDEWLSLIASKQTTITLDKTAQHAVIYTDSSLKQPLFFDPNGKGDLILPTIYTLWRLPNMLRKLIIPGQVHVNLLSGADLMIPGLQPGSELEGLLANEVVAIRAIGNDRAIAVGVMLMDEKGISLSGGKGKCTNIYHVLGDGLWKYGDQSVPNEDFLSASITVAAGNASEENPVVESEDEKASEISNAVDDQSIPMDHLVESAEIAEESPIEDVKQAIELAVTEFFRSASPPIAVGEAADAVAARDQRFDIRSTPYRTWDMLFRGFAKRGLIKIKDGFIISVNTHNLQPKSNDQDQEEAVDVGYMDDLLERALICALKTRVHDSDLPMTASMLADHVYASTSNSLNVKNSSYKSLGKLFKAFAKRGLIKLKEHKNVVTLVNINRDTKELRYDNESVTNNSKATPQQKAPKDFSKIKVVAKFEPNKRVRFLFGSAPSKEIFSMEDCKRCLQDYIQVQGLRLEQGLVRLDDTLQEAIFHGAEDRPHSIAMKDLNQRFEKQLVMYSAVVAGDEQPVFRKGTPPTIEVIVEKVGQKIRTRVKNLEAFGLDPNFVAQQGQKRFACSTAVKPLPGKSKNTLYEVLIQGRFDQEICDYLKTNTNVPFHLVSVIRKDTKCR